MSKRTMEAGGRRKKHKKGPVLCAAAILALASLIPAGRGRGDGDDTTKKQESVTPAPEEATPSPTEVISDITPEPEAVSEEFFVKIDKSDIFCGDKKFTDAQALVEYIRQQAEEGQLKNTRVVLDDTFAVSNTFEDVKSALEQNGISWAISITEQ